LVRRIGDIPFELVHRPDTPKTDKLYVLKISKLVFEEFAGSPGISIKRKPHSARILIIYSIDPNLKNELRVIEKLIK
jgi:hypothetical protein